MVLHVCSTTMSREGSWRISIATDFLGFGQPGTWVSVWALKFCLVGAYFSNFFFIICPISGSCCHLRTDWTGSSVFTDGWWIRRLEDFSGYWLWLSMHCHSILALSANTIDHICRVSRTLDPCKLLKFVLFCGSPSQTSLTKNRHRPEVRGNFALLNWCLFRNACSLQIILQGLLGSVFLLPSPPCILYKQFVLLTVKLEIGAPSCVCVSDLYTEAYI